MTQKTPFKEIKEHENASVLIFLKNGIRVVGTLSKWDENSASFIIKNCIVTEDDTESPYSLFFVDANNLLGFALVAKPVNLEEFEDFLKTRGIKKTKLMKSHLSITTEDGEWWVLRDKSIVPTHKTQRLLEELLDIFVVPEEIVDVL